MRLLSLLAALATAVLGFAQQTGSLLEPGTSAVSGVVIDALSRQPLKGCSVELVHIVNFRPSGTGAAISGPFGTYSFAGIAAGEYAVNVSCTGYLPSCYRNPNGDAPRCETVIVAVDQRRPTIDFSIVPEAKARGRVVDANGRPIGKATVRLGMPVRDAPFVTVTPTQTSDDGSFELSSLPAGDWRLEVELPAGSDSPRPPVIYFPGVLAQSEAGSITLVAGKTLDNIEVVAPSLEASRLTVRLMTAEKTPPKVDVALVRGAPLVSRRIVVDDTGTGSITGLVRGRYVVSARGYSGDRLLTAFDVVDFTGDSQEMLLHLQPSARITGRIIGDRGAAPSLAGVRVGAAWIYDGVEINPQAVDEAPVAADGTFNLTGLFGTRRLRLLGLDPAFEVRAITQGRTDVSASGVSLAAGTEANVVIVVRRR